MSPIDGVFGPGGYDSTRFDANATPRLPDGAVELARTNRIESQWLRELEADGAPPGWSVSPVPVDEGYDVFIGTTRAQMSRYNVNRIDPLDDAYQFNKGVVGGSRPPTRNTPDIAELAEDPAPPVLKKVDAAFVGYPQGEYLAAKSIVGKSGHTHTLPSPPVAFTISTDGKALQWQASQDLPLEAFGEGLWLSTPTDLGGTPDPSTLRLQAVVKKGPITYTTRGPLKLGSHARKPPAKNETKMDAPPRLKWGKDFKLKSGMSGDLQPMLARFSIVQTTALGESLGSQPTDDFFIDRVRKHHGWHFTPKHLHPDATGFKIFAQVDDVANPPWYQLIRVPKGDKFRRFDKHNEPTIYGYIDNGQGGTTLPKVPSSPDQDSKDKKDKRDKAPAHHFYLLSPADPPTEDSTGLDDPTGDIDAPIPVGLGRPGAGTYFVSYCRRFDGKPTQASQPVKVTLPDTGAGATDKVIEIRFPARVNELFNAAYGQLNQKGIPSGWTFFKQDATAYSTKDAQMSVASGIVRLRTSGAPSTNNRYPRAVSYDTTDALNTLSSTHRDRLERVRATMEVSEWVSGRAYAELVQFDEAGTEIIASTLGTLTQNGFLYIDKTIGNSALAPDISLDANADRMAVRWGIENGTDTARNLRMGFYSLYIHPFNAQPRKFEERSSPDELWTPSVDPAVPIPASHVLAIGPAPPSPGDVVASAAPLDTINHAPGGGVTVGVGSLPTGWSVSENNPSTDSQATIQATTIFQGTSNAAARFRSDDLTHLNYNFFTRNYSSSWPGGSSLAIRIRLNVERFPTKTGAYAYVAGVRTGALDPMAHFRVTNGKTLQLVTEDKDGTQKVATVKSSLSTTDIIEAEIIVGGGGTSSGVATTSVGMNGGARTPGPSIAGINWTGRTPREVQYGGFREPRSDTKWTFLFDDVVITQNGYAGTLPAPPTGVVPGPDRPKTSGGVIRQTAVDGGTINQGYAFILSTDAFEGAALGHEVDEYYVAPGVQRTAAVFLKPQDFSSDMRVFVLAAYNEDGDRTEMGCLSEQTGANAVANSVSGWYEMWLAYTPPAGYFRMRWEHENTEGGSYVFQEPLDAVGNLTTSALRDAKRVESRATSSTFSVLLQARVPDQVGTNMERGYLEERKSLQVVSEIPDALSAFPNPVTTQARATDTTPPTSGLTAWQTDFSLVPDYEWIEVQVTLAGDGTSSPVIPAGGISCLYSTYQPMLCRADRTALPGGAIIGGDSGSNLPRSVTRHDYDTEPVGGIALARAITERISRLGSFAIRVYTEDAEDEISYDMLATDEGQISVISEWMIEDWAQNAVMRVRFYGPSNFVPEIEYDVLDRRIADVGGRRIPRVMEVESTQVLEAGPLENE